MDYGNRCWHRRFSMHHVLRVISKRPCAACGYNGAIDNKNVDFFVEMKCSSSRRSAYSEKSSHLKSVRNPEYLSLCLDPPQLPLATRRLVIWPQPWSLMSGDAIRLAHQFVLLLPCEMAPIRIANLRTVVKNRQRASKAIQTSRVFIFCNVSAQGRIVTGDRI